MSITDLSLFESYVPEFGVMYSLIVDSHEHAQAIAYGEAGDLIKSYVAKDTNTYLLGMIMNGKRVVNTIVPIESLEDCGDVILRTPEAQVYTDTSTLRHESHSNVPDRYLHRTQTGTVQGFECPAQQSGTVVTPRLQSMSGSPPHVFQGWTANQAFWDGLPEIARETMLQC